MKLNRIITLCAMAATLAISATSLLAQDNGGGNGGPGGGQGGGQRRNRQGGGNFDPAQMQQRMLDRVQEELGFTNDTDWDAVKPLVQKVMDARMAVGTGGMGRMFGGGRNRGGTNGTVGDQTNNRPRGGMFGQPSPEQDALQKALDDNAPSSQIKDLLAKYKASQQAKQAKLEAAQADLKAVLTSKQEAQAYLLGLVN
jgi:Spy/CpxP family protein refolding chaperone